MPELFQLVPFDARTGNTCKTCAYLRSMDVHHSGPSKIVHKCSLKRAGELGISSVTRLKWPACRFYCKREDV